MWGEEAWRLLVLAGWHAGHTTPVVPKVTCWEAGSGVRDKEVSLGHQKSNPHRLWTHKWASPRQAGSDSARGRRCPTCMRGEDDAELNSGKFSYSGVAEEGCQMDRAEGPSRPTGVCLDPLGCSEGTKGPLELGSEGQ